MVANHKRDLEAWLGEELGSHESVGCFDQQYRDNFLQDWDAGTTATSDHVDGESSRWISDSYAKIKALLKERDASVVCAGDTHFETLLDIEKNLYLFYRYSEDQTSKVVSKKKKTRGNGPQRNTVEEIWMHVYDTHGSAWNDELKAWHDVRNGDPPSVPADEDEDVDVDEDNDETVPFMTASSVLCT